MEMDSKFSNSSYLTPESHKRDFVDKIVFNTPVWFYYNLWRYLAQASNKAKKGMYDTKEWHNTSNQIFNKLEDCGVRFEVEGLDNIKNLNGTPSVFIANHMSTMETFTLPNIIGNYQPVSFVIKQSLREGSFFGPIMSAMDAIVVTRQDPRKDLMDVLEQGTEMLKKGISVIIFPQSTRTTEFDESKFNTLGIKLAIKAGAPVVPLALKTDAWDNGKMIRGFGKLFRKKKVHYTFGEAMEIEGRGKEEHRKIIDFITGNLNKWRER